MKQPTKKPDQPRILSAGQMRASETKHNKEARKKAQQIGYAAGYTLGN